MDKKIVIINYDAGNLGSVEKAFKYLGYSTITSSDPKVILSADKVVLPGVGAFNDAMSSLEKRKLVLVIEEVVSKGTPFLGICLGLQLLFKDSEEGDKPKEGLKLFNGCVKLFPSNMGLKVPHMGWNSIEIDNECPYFNDIGENPYVYFVHSYYVESQEKSIVVANCKYGIEFDAAVYKNNVFATQFHPEKSGKIGLKILDNWAKE